MQPQKPLLNEIDMLILQSQRYEKDIRKEHVILVDYYTNNKSELLDEMIQLKNNLKVDDFLSADFEKRTDKILSNINNNKFIFRNEFLIDSYQKIFNQIDNTPKEVRQQEEVLKILFFTLADEPYRNGSRLIMLAMKIDWKQFITIYQTKLN